MMMSLMSENDEMIDDGDDDEDDDGDDDDGEDDGDDDDDDDDEYECLIIFNVIANRVFHLGENGTAHAVKLAMNLQITMLALALSEGITLVRGANIDPKIFLEILNSTYFKTGMSENKAFKMIKDQFEGADAKDDLYNKHISGI